ncbi:hypothetical protein DM02DRAFT_54461 [Periconia macrospinosa]|uniref:SnoaL-like domain-containing protein n=1 Tax=Periconia macrospinosa TaxID=97972 RepID=A0A2V1E6Y5_9PLEO|nr:hypothetical protein DM02DRAFT_54461 [Periconia macrospinosa]
MSSSNNTTPKSARVQAAETFVSIFQTLDTTPLNAILSSKYYHEMGPSTISGFGPWDKAGFIAHVNGLKKTMTAFPVTITEIIDSDSSNSVWVWTASDIKWRAEAIDGDPAEWSYQGQNMFMFWFDAEGKIEKCIELLDSHKSIGVLMPLFQRAAVNLGKGE